MILADKLTYGIGFTILGFALLAIAGIAYMNTLTDPTFTKEFSDVVVIALFITATISLLGGVLV
jgi:hypothetical protein